jgi:hypothetical protein
MSVGKTDSNQLRPVLKEKIPSLLVFDKSLKKMSGVKSINRSGMSKLRIPDDILRTPPGNRMIKHKTRLNGELSSYVKNNFDGQIYDILMGFVMDEKYLIPRSLYAIEDTKVKVPWLPYELEVRGVSDHVLAYTQRLRTYDTVMTSQLRDKMTEAVTRFPLPPSYQNVVDKSEWISRIRTGTNSGWPDWVTTDLEYRSEIVTKYKPDLTSLTTPDKTIFTLFYRTQPGKSRAVCGGDARLKVVGGFTTHTLTSLIGPSEGIAWGDYTNIFSMINDHYRTSNSVISLDFSRLDTTINRDLHHHALDAVGKLWGTKDVTWEHFFEMYKKSVTDNAWLFVVPGLMVKVEDGLLSGEPLTQFTDSIVVMGVTLLAADYCGWTLNGYTTLGDDVIMFIEEEWNDKENEKFQKFADELKKETGLIVNVEKSFPGNIGEGGVGIFLQYFITPEGIFGHPLRKPHSLGFMERDSSIIKGVDFHKFARSEGAKIAYLVRSAQITASVTEEVPGVEEFIGIMQKYDKLLQDPELVEKSLNAAKKYQRTTGGEVATINIDPKWIIPYL